MAQTITVLQSNYFLIKINNLKNIHKSTCSQSPRRHFFVMNQAAIRFKIEFKIPPNNIQHCPLCVLGLWCIFFSCLFVSCTEFSPISSIMLSVKSCPAFITLHYNTSIFYKYNLVRGSFLPCLFLEYLDWRGRKSTAASVISQNIIQKYGTAMLDTSEKKMKLMVYENCAVGKLYN